MDVQYHQSSVDERTMNRPSPATSRFGPVEALFLSASIALGIWISMVDPRDFETALGLVDTQSRFEAETNRGQGGRDGHDGGTKAVVLIEWLSRWCGKLLGVGGRLLPFVTLGAAAAIFRHRGARSRRALRHIGILTMAVAASFVASSLVSELILRRFQVLQTGYTHNHFDSLWRDLGIETGLALSGLWAVIALGRHWRANPGWADRLGRALGVAWISYAVLSELSQ